LRSALQSNTR